MRTLSKLFMVFFFIFTLHITLYTLHSYAEIPHLLNYQGKLTDTAGKPVTDIDRSVTFRIYDAELGGNLLWEETQTVKTDKGIFNVLLGRVTALNIPFDKPYFLAIKVGTDNEMQPRQRLASVGYAIRAEYGVPKGVVVMWSGLLKDIPEGWALCDGSNDTPNLRDRFIVGAGSTYAVAGTGGEATHVLTTNEMPAHAHKYLEPNSGGSWGGSDGSAGCTRDEKDTGSSGKGEAHNNLPPYYALAFIMKT